MIKVSMSMNKKKSPDNSPKFFKEIGSVLKEDFDESQEDPG